MRPFLMYPDRKRVRGALVEFQYWREGVVMCHPKVMVMRDPKNDRPFILVSAEYELVDSIEKAGELVARTIGNVRQELKSMRLEAIRKL